MDKEYRISICGNECNVVSSEGDEYVAALANEVEERIQEVYSSSDKVTFAVAAMIAALNLCEEIQQMRLGCEDMQAQMKSYLQEVNRANEAKDEALFEIERLRREMDRLRQNNRY